MKITPINSHITLHTDTHTYSWAEKDASIPCFSVSEIIHGKRKVTPTPAMLEGTRIHTAIQKYIESGSNAEPEKDIAFYVNAVRSTHDTQLGACEKAFAALIEIDDENKLYLCGTPDLIIDDTVFEFKTGQMYNYHTEQIEMYLLLTGNVNAKIIYGTHVSSFDNYIVVDSTLQALKAKMLKRLTEDKEPVEMKDEDLVDLMIQKAYLKEQLSTLEQEIGSKTSTFGNRTVVFGSNGSVEFVRSIRMRRDVDRKYVEQHCPEAISLKETAVLNSKFI